MNDINDVIVMHCKQYQLACYTIDIADIRHAGSNKCTHFSRNLDGQIRYATTKRSIDYEISYTRC